MDLQGASGGVRWDQLATLFLPMFVALLTAAIILWLGNYGARTVRIDEKIAAMAESIAEQRNDIRWLRDAVMDLQGQPAAEMAEMWTALSEVSQNRRAGKS